MPLVEQQFTLVEFDSTLRILYCLDFLQTQRRSLKPVERVRITDKTPRFRTIDLNAERQLFQELALHPLVDLNIHYTSNIFSVRNLVDVIQGTRTTLKLLRLSSMFLQGERGDLIISLQQHPTLEELKMTRIGLGNLDPLVRSFASCRSLQILDLHALGIDSEAPMDYHQAVQELISSAPNLRSLSLGRLPIVDEGTIIDMLHLLEGNKTIQQFFLRSFFDWNLLEEASITAVGDMLMVNKTLERLSFPVGHATLQPIVESLRTNRTLKSLRFTDGSQLTANESVSQGFVDMLKTNCVLEQMELCAAPSHVSEIQLWFKLNRAGRKKLLEDTTATPQDWLAAIISCSDDERALFYLLSKKPSLCRIALEKSASHGRPTKRAKLGEWKS